MTEEVQGQADVQPGAEGGGIADATTKETTTAPQAVDYAALEEKVAGLGDGYTLSNLGEKYEDARRGMNDAQRKSVETERRYEPVSPLIDKLQSDPQFAAKLQQAAQEYFTGGEVDAASSDIPPDVSQSLNPLYNRIANLEIENAGNKIDREIDKLRADGMPIDDSAYNQIMQRMVDTKSDDVSAIAWGIIGPQMVKNAAKQATTDVTDKIKDNSAKYIPTPGGPTSGKPYDVTQMNQADIDSDMMKELEERIGRTS